MRVCKGVVWGQVVWFRAMSRNQAAKSASDTSPDANDSII